MLVAWLTGAFLAVPAAIRAAHSGSVPLLDRLLEGRHELPVSVYLADWHASLPRLAFVSLTGALVLFLGLRLVRQARIDGRPATDESVSGEVVAPLDTPRTLSRSAIPLLAAGFGLLAGLGEAYYLGGRVFFLGLVAPGLRAVSPDSLWMAPLANMVAFAAVGAAVWLASTLISWLTTVRAVVLIFSFLTIFVWISITYRVESWAAVLLGAGGALQLGRFAASHHVALRPLAVRWGVFGAILLVATGAAVTIIPRIAESRARAGLPSPAPDAENVVLIVLDTQRAGSTGVNGGAPGSTPHLERWAAAGTVFERAITTAPWTLPAHATMFTGRHNADLGTDYLVPLDDRYPTLAELLAAKGYVTVGFVANFDLASAFYGLGRGFVRYEDHPRSIRMVVASAWLTRGLAEWVFRLVGHHGRIVRKRAESINRHFFRWLDGERPDAFFAFLNYFDAHDPYLPPAPFDTVHAAASGRYWLYRTGAGNAADTYTESERAELENAYLAGIRYLDHHIGQLLQGLDERGLLDQTIVIVTSDHGEEFGEHGWIGHGQNLFLPVLHVPMVIWAPSGATGTHVDQTVSIRDIPATVLDLLDMPPALPGRSLARFVRPGTEPDADESSPAASQLGVNGDWSLVTDRYHYVVDSEGRVSLYDLVEDPNERADLSGDPAFAPVLAALRQQLRHEIPVGSPPDERDAGTRADSSRDVPARR